MASSPVTRASLMTRVLQQGNTSGYVEQTAELPQLVDTSLAKLHNILTSLYEDYRVTRGTPIPLVANQDVYPLPADCFKLRAVFYLTPSATTPADLTQAARTLMSRLDPTADAGTSTNSSYPSQPFGYILEDQTLVVVPRPSATSNYVQLKYVPTYTPDVNDNTPIDLMFAFGWDEWVVQDVVIQIRNKAMMPVAEIVAERDRFEEKLRLQAKNRDAFNAPKVRNTGWRYGNGYPPWGSFSIR